MYLKTILWNQKKDSSVGPVSSLPLLLTRSNLCSGGWWWSNGRNGQSTTCRRRCCWCKFPLCATSSSRQSSWSERTLHLRQLWTLRLLDSSTYNHHKNSRPAILTAAVSIANRTPKQIGITSSKYVRYKWFLQNASTFNCGLIAFEKLDIGWVPTAWFPWQQPHQAGVRNTRPGWTEAATG